MKLLSAALVIALLTIVTLYARTRRIETLLDFQHVITSGLLDYKADTSRVLNAMSRNLDVSDRVHVFDPSGFWEEGELRSPFDPLAPENFMNPNFIKENKPMIYDMRGEVPSPSDPLVASGFRFEDVRSQLEEENITESPVVNVEEIKGVPSEFEVYKL